MGCRKDFDLTTANSAPNVNGKGKLPSLLLDKSVSIKDGNYRPAPSIEEAKNWLAQQQTQSFSNSTFSIDPNWARSYFDHVPSGKNYLLVPFESTTMKVGEEESELTVMFYRNPQNQITGQIISYSPTREYRARKAGAFDMQDFSGIIVFFDIHGHFKAAPYFENGQFVRFGLNSEEAGTNFNAGAASCEGYPIWYECGPQVFTFVQCVAYIQICDAGAPYTFPNSGLDNSGSGGSSGGGGTNGEPGCTVCDNNDVPTLFYKQRLVGRGVITLQEFNFLLQYNQNQVIALLNFVTNNNFSPESKSAAKFYVRSLQMGLNDFSIEELKVSLTNFYSSYLEETNYSNDAVEWVNAILKNLKDAKELATPTSGFCNKKDLYDYVKLKNPTLTEGQLQDKIGTMFENAWNAWNVLSPVGDYEPNIGDAFKRFSPSRNAYVAPDGFMKSIRSPNGVQYGVDQKAHWVECKASNKDYISLGDYDGQIKGEIEALSLWNPVACINKIAAMSYVTTIDMIPSSKVTKYANDRGIWVLNSYPYFEIRADGKMYITFTSVFRYSVQFGEPVLSPTMAALKQTLSLNYVEFK